jgi:hypothetical protein
MTSSEEAGLIDEETALSNCPLVRRHLLIGWWSLLLFLSLGLALEAMNGLKLGWYVNVPNHTRRIMWTLAHAHGTILAIVHVAFAVTLSITGLATAPRLQTASSCLTLAIVCLPGGFFLGGLFFWGGDPGLGILFVPIGGALLLAAVLTTARELRAAGSYT